MDGTSVMSWTVIGPILIGMVIVPAIQWVAKWVNGKGAELIHEELVKLQQKLNENSVLGQISADDALIGICEHALPVVVNELSVDIQKALADGKLDAADWKEIGDKLWHQVKDQVQGGANDYLKHSSFADGAALASMVAQRFFHLQVAQKKGVVTEAPRVPAVATPEAAK